jgi:hypothetical protein
MAKRLKPIIVLRKVQAGHYRGLTPGGHVVSVMKREGSWRVWFVGGMQPDRFKSLYEALTTLGVWLDAIYMYSQESWKPTPAALRGAK